MRSAYSTSAFVIAAMIFAGSVVGGCFIVTGSTDDYQLADTGAPEAAALAETCVSASDCDAGEICCLSISATSLGTTCQVGPCVEGQICGASAECSGGETCTSQQCSSNGLSIAFQACGTLPGCAP